MLLTQARPAMINHHTSNGSGGSSGSSGSSDSNGSSGNSGSTSEMLHHCEASLSEQQTTHSLICHGTQQS